MTAPDPGVRAEIDDFYAASMWALDMHDLEAYLDFFTSEGEFREIAPDGTERVLRGIRAIRADAERRFDGPLTHQHRVTQPRYREVEGGWEVSSVYVSVAVDEHTAAASIGAAGWLRDVLLPTPDGWRIHARDVGPWNHPPSP